MNYRIVCNTPVNGTYTDFVLFDYTVEGRELSKAVLTRSFNGNLQDGQLVFTIHPGHYAYDKIMLSLSTITVYDGETEIFRGRPVSLQTSKTMLKTYTVEHMMKFLIDVPDVFSVEDTDGNVDLSLAIPAVINGYNSMVSANRQIALPSSIPITGKAKASKGASVYSNLTAWLKEAGYYARIVKINNVYTLSFATDTGVESTDFSVVFGENVLDYAETVNLDKLYTAVYPVGVDSGNESATAILVDDTVTTTGQYKVDASKHLIYNDAVVPSYGLVILYAEIDLKDESSKTKQTVYNKGVQALKNATAATESFSISAVDPRLVGMAGSVPIEGNYYPVTIPPFFGDEPVYLKLTQIVTDMTKPSAGSLTFGGSRNLLTDQSAAISTAAGRAETALQTASAALTKANAAATPAQVAEAIAQSEERVANYVQETGADGIWTWTKWASGKAECRGITQLTVAASGWTSAGNVWCADGTETLPAGLFVDAPDVIPAVQGSTAGNFAGWAGAYLPSETTAARYRVYRHNNYSTQRTVRVLLRCTGRWK